MRDAGVTFANLRKTCGNCRDPLSEMGGQLLDSASSDDSANWAGVSEEAKLASAPALFDYVYAMTASRPSSSEHATGKR